MNNDRYLVIYNTCELKGNNLWWYINCLQNLLRQDYSNFQIAVSGCKLTQATKVGLRQAFKDKIWFNFIDDLHTVNVTFNHTAKVIEKAKGPFDGFIYIDSGMNTLNQTNILSEINKRSITRQFGMIAMQPSTDTGYEMWFGKPEIGFAFTGEDFVIPVGKAIPLHFNFFDRRLMETYGQLVPDIFRTFCTESTFTFLNAAIGLKWVIVKDLIIQHAKAADGPSSGFNHIGSREGWNNLLGDLDIRELIMTPEGKALGMGYEEAQGIFIHDPNCYDENGTAKNPKLKEFIKEKLFVNKSIVDYNSINHQLHIS